MTDQIEVYRFGENRPGYRLVVTKGGKRVFIQNYLDDEYDNPQLAATHHAQRMAEIHGIHNVSLPNKPVDLFAMPRMGSAEQTVSRDPLRKGTRRSKSAEPASS